MRVPVPAQGSRRRPDAAKAAGMSSTISHACAAMRHPSAFFTSRNTLTSRVTSPAFSVISQPATAVATLPTTKTSQPAPFRAALRRRSDPQPFVLGKLAIDYDKRLVTVAGRAVELTPTEYGLLRAFSFEAGRVVTYETLLHQVWSERRHASWKVVRAFVKQFRAKLGDDAADPSWIFNVRDVGYRMPRPTASSCSRLV